MTDHALTPETLAELERLRADATPGPWVAEFSGKTGPVVMDAESRNALDHVAQCPHYRGHSDAALIAAAVNHLPALIAEIKRLAHERDFWKSQDDSRRVLVRKNRVERDAALAEVAALRERIAALADEWSTPESHRNAAWLRERDAADRIRAALDVDTAALDAAPADRDDEAEGGGVE